MSLTRTAQGLEVTLKETGGGRFVVAGLLMIGLAIWVVGETFGVWLLARGGWALVTGRPPAPGWEPLSPAPALAFGLFLLAWLTVWSAGGWRVGCEVVRLLCGQVRLMVRPDRVLVEHGGGLFRLRRSLAREQILRFGRQASSGALIADTKTGLVELTRCGGAAELAQLAAELNAACQLAGPAAGAGSLPMGWYERISPQGETILVENPFGRRRWARVAWAGCALSVAIAACLLSAASGSGLYRALGAVIAVAAGGLGWAARRLGSTAEEWVAGAGALRRRRRQGEGVETRFVSHGLEIREETDEDGCRSFALVAVGKVGANLRLSPRASRRECTLLTRYGDAADVRAFGDWLARRTQLPLQDRTMPEAADG